MEGGKEIRRYAEYYRLVELAYFDSNGKAVANNEDGVARITIAYDSQDEITKTTSYDVNGEEIPRLESSSFSPWGLYGESL